MKKRKQPNFKSPFATKFTRTGTIDRRNYKPYRTPEQKALARSLAVKESGRYIAAGVPRSCHP